MNGNGHCGGLDSEIVNLDSLKTVMDGSSSSLTLDLKDLMGCLIDMLVKLCSKKEFWKEFHFDTMGGPLEIERNKLNSK
jgi:hypothetical protein